MQSGQVQSDPQAGIFQYSNQPKYIEIMLYFFLFLSKFKLIKMCGEGKFYINYFDKIKC